MKKKTRGSATKRFRVTKTGKVMFAHQFGSHLKSKKSKSRIRRQNVPGVLDKGFGRKVKRMMGLA